MNWAGKGHIELVIMNNSKKRALGWQGGASYIRFKQGSRVLHNANQCTANSA